MPAPDHSEASSPLAADGRFRVPEHVLTRELDGQMVLLNLDSGEYFALNEVGTRIWLLLAEDRSPEEVLGVLGEEYDVATDRLLEDMEGLVRELTSQGLLLPATS